MLGKDYTRSAERATVSQAFFDDLQNAHQFTVPSPGDTIEEIMFNAGKAAVIEWIRQRIKNSAQDNRVNRTAV